MFKFINKNVVVVSVSQCIGWFLEFLWQPFFILYLMKELGAPIGIVGIISMIRGSTYVIFQLPGGMLADKFGRKKIIMLGISSKVIAPILYLFAKTWPQIILASLVAAVFSVYVPASNALIAESLPYKRRGAGFGILKLLTSPATIFPPFIGGWVMDMIGLAKGIRLFLTLDGIAHIILLTIQAKFITETLEVERRRKLQTLREQLSQFTKLPRTLYAMLAVSCLSGVAMRISMPFLVVYGVDVIGLSKTQWGFISMVMGLVSLVLSLPSGMLADKIGRKPLILLAKVIGPIGTLGLAFSRNFTQVLLVRVISSLGAGLGGEGGLGGGPAWQALISDLAPTSQRASIMGMLGTISGLTGPPFSLVGGYLWDNYYPALPFQMTFLIGITPPLILYLFVKEPEVKEK